MTRAVLVDDEPHLTAHLRRLLQELWPELAIVATGENGEQALQLVDTHRPDLLFLDIRMPVLDGIAVAASLANNASTRAPLIVFTTAYDQYALEAFDAAAVDYLLKPISLTRLQSCVKRLRQRLDQHGDSQQETLKSLLAEFKQPAKQQYLNWLRAGQGETTELIAVNDVVYFKSEHKYTSAFTAQREHVLREPIKSLAQQLDPACFWQVHRSLIVNVADIDRATRDLRGRYTLALKRRPETLRASSAYNHLFKQM